MSTPALIGTIVPSGSCQVAILIGGGHPREAGPDLAALTAREGAQAVLTRLLRIRVWSMLHAGMPDPGTTTPDRRAPTGSPEHLLSMYQGPSALMRGHAVHPGWGGARLDADTLETGRVNPETGRGDITDWAYLFTGDGTLMHVIEGDRGVDLGVRFRWAGRADAPAGAGGPLLLFWGGCGPGRVWGRGMGGPEPPHPHPALSCPPHQTP